MLIDRWIHIESDKGMYLSRESDLSDDVLRP